tara:strand:- start:24 stop:428 length:405 start_codon:yes stop_codon:yes gene_type:complete
MARVTVEDCILKISNRFRLVALAAQRARHLTGGAALTVERDNDKNPVISLREIADETVDINELEESLVKSLQKYVEIDEPEEEEIGIDFSDKKSHEKFQNLKSEKIQPSDDNDDNKDLKPESDELDEITIQMPD